MPQKRALVWILIAAAVIRLSLFALIAWQDQPGTYTLADTRGYMQIADNVLAGHGYTQATTSPYIPDGMRTPVLPLLFASVKEITGTTVAYIFIQIALAVLLVFLTHRLALIVSASERIALWAAALIAFEPYSIFINLSLLTETIFAFTITAATYYLCVYVRDRAITPLCIASGLFAFAAMTRPIAQFIPLLLVLLVLYRERPRTYAKYLCAAIIPFLLVASPWLIRNYQVFGTASFSSGGFQNVYSDLGATIISYRDGIEWRTAKTNLENDFAKRHHIPVSTIQQNLALSPVLFKEGLLLMVHNPGSTVKSFVSVSIAYFTNDAWSYYFDHWNWMAPFEYGFSPTHSLITEGPVATIKHVLRAAGPALAIPVAGRIFWLVTSFLFFVGLWVLFWQKGDKRAYALTFFFFVFYYLGLSWSAGAGVNGRYRYPVNPLIFTAACVGVQYLFARIKSMMKKSAI